MGPSCISVMLLKRREESPTHRLGLQWRTNMESEDWGRVPGGPDGKQNPQLASLPPPVLLDLILTLFLVLAVGCFLFPQPTHLPP